MCYATRPNVKASSQFNLDHQAWSGPKQRPEDNVRKAINLRHLHPGNDWSNLSVQKHAGEDGQRKPSKRPNVHLYDISSDMPSCFTSTTQFTRSAAEARVHGKRSTPHDNRMSADNPFARDAPRPATAPNGGGGGTKKPTKKKNPYRARTPYAEQKVSHHNDFMGKRSALDRRSTNVFYNSNGGWGAAQGVASR